jgi:UDP-2-acetamido-2,6-beta-L-arabino-hexul-4-ose reductase
LSKNEIRIGITGQSGFVGTHLFNVLGQFPDKYIRVPFEDDYFKKKSCLEDFVNNCDVIIHLAAMNRHNDPQILFDTNVKLVKQIIEACKKTLSKPHIIFSSSIQEQSNNHYGRSKKEGRRLFELWAQTNNAHCSGLVIPNLFGPFGLPHYNSVVATFCHQLTHGEVPQVAVDAEIGLLYISELGSEIMAIIDKNQFNEDNSQTSVHMIRPTKTIRVSSLLAKLISFKESYYDQGFIPNLDNQFDLCLFNTFLCYIDKSDYFPFHLSRYSDSRGIFVETMKLKSGGQISFSTTNPGVTRGNHYHTRKAERFAVIRGKARIEMRRIGTEEKLSFILDGELPSFVDMPIWHTHNITNIGDDTLFTVFWINEHYNSEDTDTFFEEV